MSEETTGLVVFCGITIVVSLALHVVIRSRVLAVLISATVSITVFLAIATARMGYLDPFFPIALVYGGFWAGVIAFVVGVVVNHLRGRHPPGHCQQCGYNLTGNVSGKCPECGKPT